MHIPAVICSDFVLPKHCWLALNACLLWGRREGGACLSCLWCIICKWANKGFVIVFKCSSENHAHGTKSYIGPTSGCQAKIDHNAIQVSSRVHLNSVSIMCWSDVGAGSLSSCVEVMLGLAPCQPKDIIAKWNSLKGDEKTVFFFPPICLLWLAHVCHYPLEWSRMVATFTHPSLSIDLSIHGMGSIQPLVVDTDQQWPVFVLDEDNWWF